MEKRSLKEGDAAGHDVTAAVGHSAYLDGTR
jgi:hypothetical protein